MRQLPVSMPGSAGASIRMVPVDEVLYLQAADKYVRGCLDWPAMSRL